MGWTEEQTLNTKMSAILLAYEGRVDMLRAIFGGGSEPAPEVKGQSDMQIAQAKADHDKKKGRVK